MKIAGDGGRTIFGAFVGILMLDTNFPRILGDIGNALTFPFPVLFRIVKGAGVKRVVFERDAQLIDEFVAAGKELVANGARGLVTSCGFMALFQKEIAAALPVPFVSSSLMQIPMVYSMTSHKTVGVITACSTSLTPKHFEGVDAGNIPVVIEGIENSDFGRALINDHTEYDYNEAEEAVTGAAKRLLQRDKTIGAIVLECTNLPPYAEAVSRVTGLPVFDIVTLTRMFHSTLGSDRTLQERC
ncbi:aspartate/glutamate racemase family protein [Aminivibrio sp.]|uniref:aspartate/glutamate racemase family protein n=1 Tax=Aminivibrio sp. TaxID=1872489 RepID=UPI00345EBD72